MPRNGSDWRRYQILVLAAVFAFFAVDRFYRITEIGMTGTDTFTYWSIATDWVKGHATLTEHYRPVLYLLYSMAMSIFGENDYSIKILNASLDMLTILFIFLTARKLTKNFLVSIAACSLYALLPGPLIYAARSELSHASTTFFLTAGMYAFTFYYGKGKTEKSLETGMLVVSGFLFGCAANTHPDVVLVGPIFIILLLRAHVVHKNARIHQIIIAFGLFTLAFFVPFICAGAYFGFKNTLNNIFTNYQRQGQDSSSNIIDTFRALKGIQQGYFEFFATNLMKYVFVGMLVVNLFLYIFRSKGSSVSIFLLPMLFHYVAYCVLIHRSHLYRLFIPWLPYLMLYICYWLYELIAIVIRNKRAAAVVFLLLWTLLTVYHRPQIQGAVFISAQQEVSVYREVHDVLKGKYGFERKALLTPLVLENVETPLNKKVYFGSCAQYLSTSLYLTLDDVIRLTRVKYIIIFKEKFDTRNLKEYNLSVRIKRYYGLELDEYSIQGEIELLNEYARKLNGKLIYESDKAIIYEL